MLLDRYEPCMQTQAPTIDDAPVHPRITDNYTQTAKACKSKCTLDEPDPAVCPPMPKLFAKGLPEPIYQAFQSINAAVNALHDELLRLQIG